MGSENELLSLSACVVKGNLRNVADEYSASGILLDPRNGIIISHGSILTEFILQDKKLLKHLIDGQFIKPKCLQGCSFKALIDSRWRTKKTAYFPFPEVNITSQAEVQSADQVLKTSSYTEVSAQFIGAFRSENFHQAVSSLMPKETWTFSDSDVSQEDNKAVSDKSKIHDNEVTFNLLSYFLVMRIKPVDCEQSPLEKWRVSSDKPYRCHIGDVAEIVATPFGALSPEVFYNSYSCGVVCNVSGPQNCWILTDARCIPGSEGGPLFIGTSKNNRSLSGIIAASLCWKNNEWVGFAVACSLDSIQSSLTDSISWNSLKYGLKIAEKWSTQKALVDRSQNTKYPNQLLSLTVRVEVGGTWGSGVLIDADQGVVLTCSHVLKDASTNSITITPFQGSSKIKASVVYRQHPLTGPYDLAVLKCQQGILCPHLDFQPVVSVPQLGEKVYAVGHAVFNTQLQLHPSVSAGVISKVIKVDGCPVMVQSTCAIHPGASGGPLLNANGDLVGIMVCNTRDNTNASSFPHLNMSVPAISVKPALDSYIKSGDEKHLKSLQVKSSYVIKLWALGSPTWGNESIAQQSKL